MKENKYDDEVFFQKYAQMGRSKRGLSGAGEWPELQRMLPDFFGKRVLDLGCGYGWHCAYAAERGAARVLGTDISERMLEVAREKVTHAGVSFERIAMEDARFPEGSFDVVLSSLALHYVADYIALVRKVHGWLAPGGSFVFSVEHPVYTAQGSEDWCYSADGEIRHFPVDHYFSEGPRRTVFLGEPVVKYHRTLTTCLGALTDAGFLLRKVVEPAPPEEMRGEPGMMDELRRPMMLLISAVKPVSDEA